MEDQLDKMNERRKADLECFPTWQETYPEFKEIADIAMNFESNWMLLEFSKETPPFFMWLKASQIYKKCLSYKVKIQSSKLKKLGYGYNPKPFCIDKKVVDNFTNYYQSWGIKAHGLWRQAYYFLSDYRHNTGYKYHWRFDVEHGMLNHSLARARKAYDEALSHLMEGENMLIKHENIVDDEYRNKALALSYYDREIEIITLEYQRGASDEEYCQVYIFSNVLWEYFMLGLLQIPRLDFLSISGEHLEMNVIYLSQSFS